MIGDYLAESSKVPALRKGIFRVMKSLREE